MRWDRKQTTTPTSMTEGYKSSIFNVHRVHTSTCKKYLYYGGWLYIYKTIAIGINGWKAEE